MAVISDWCRFSSSATAPSFLAIVLVSKIFVRTTSATNESSASSEVIVSCFIKKVLFEGLGPGGGDGRQLNEFSLQDPFFSAGSFFGVAFVSGLGDIAEFFSQNHHLSTPRYVRHRKAKGKLAGLVESFLAVPLGGEALQDFKLSQLFAGR